MINKIYFDGAITKNPGGIASSGVVLCNDKDIVLKFETQKTDEDSTCNISEWLALKNCLEFIENLPVGKDDIFKVFGDSQLVINGINEKWKVSQPRLNEIYKDCKGILERLKALGFNITFEWISRDFNKADEYSRLCEYDYNNEYTKDGLTQEFTQLASDF